MTERATLLFVAQSVRARIIIPLGAMMALLLGGCASYRAQPLDGAALQRALQAQALPTVKIAGAQFENPLIPPQEIDGRNGFTPDEIALMAVVVSPRLRVARDQRGVTRAQVLQAGILPNPQFGFTTDLPHGNADPARSIGLSWEVTALLARHDNMTAAKSTAQALDLDLAWGEWQVAQQARLLALRVLAGEELLPLAQAREDAVTASRALIQRALQRGLMKSPALTQANAAVTTSRNERLAMEQDMVASRIALNVLLGQPAGTPLRLKANPPGNALAAEAIAAGQLLVGLETRRLDLVALKLGYQSQEAKLRAAIKAQFPKIGLNVSRAQDTGNVKTRGFGITIDVPLFDRNQGQIAAATATRQQLFDEYVARVAETRAEVVQLLSAWKSAGEQLQSATADLQGLAAVEQAMAQQLSDQATDILSYRDAQQALFSQRMECARLRQTRVELGVALAIATGRPNIPMKTPQQAAGNVSAFNL